MPNTNNLECYCSTTEFKTLFNIGLEMLYRYPVDLVFMLVRAVEYANTHCTKKVLRHIFLRLQNDYFKISV
jgi:hypothetical protein